MHVRLAIVAVCCGSIACTSSPSGGLRPGSRDAEGRDGGFADAALIDGEAEDAATSDAAPEDANVPDAPSIDAGPSGPRVDRSHPQLFSFTFTARDVDPTATRALGTELGVLDTRAEPRGLLVVHLHGAGAPTRCGATGHANFLAALGFHVAMPCYVSDYGVQNCGDDIGGCRLEAFDGTDHSPVVDIRPPDAIEPRVVKMLARLQELNPAGDWQYFVDGDKPRWSAIIISGISHGASSAGLIGIVRGARRVVMLSGPLDTNQAWLRLAGITPRDEYFGFTHTADSQHPGHLAAFESLGLPGAPISIDSADPPYSGSHRLITSARTSDGHSSTELNGASPRTADGSYLFAPVWRTMYGP